MLRSAAIVIQLCTILAVYFFMQLDIALLPLLAVIAVEILFHIISIMVFKHREGSNLAIFCQVLADVLFLSVLMLLSGGATNAFVSLLLLPIVIGAVSLPAKLLSIISFSAIASYSLLLFNLPEPAHHHMDMSTHFIGMWVNFLLSVIVVTIVVGTMARLIVNRERAIARHREEQLRSEQLLALGVASAQVTHQLATPLANMQLLFEELAEDFPDHVAVTSMKEPLIQCGEQLGHFRSLASSIRENKQSSITVQKLIAQIEDTVALQFPHTQLEIDYSSEVTPAILHTELTSNVMLLPALLNLVQNGIEANAQHDETRLVITVSTAPKKLLIAIRDFGHGVEAAQATIGQELVLSKEGLGMAMLLSNTTLERLGGSLTLVNHVKQGAIAQVSLPLGNNA